MVEMTSNSRSSMASEADVILGEAPASILLLYILIWFAPPTALPPAPRLLNWCQYVANFCSGSSSRIEKKRWRRTTRLSFSQFSMFGERWLDGWLGGRTDAHTYSLNFFGCKMVGKVLVSFISSIFFSSVKFSTYIRYELVRCFSKSQNFFLQLKLGHKKILLTLTEKLVKHH